MLNWIKNYIANRKAKRAARIKAWNDSWNSYLFAELNVVLDLLGMPHSALSLCSKCVHLAGRKIDKETMLAVFKIHDIKLPKSE